MKMRLWILATGPLVVMGTIATASAVYAQPAAPLQENEGGATSITAAELERRIGGRTSLELAFQNAAVNEVATAMAQSSGLRFGSPSEEAWRIEVQTTRADGAYSRQIFADRFNGTVPKSDFWLGVRAWNQVEDARGEEVPRRPAAMSISQLRPSSSRSVSVCFDRDTGAWNLTSLSDIATGQAVDAWPCLILATGFERKQNLSIQPTKLPAKAGEKMPAKAAEKALAPAGFIQMRSPSVAQEEEVEGGRLNDALSLNLSVYLEPKMLPHARTRLLIREARDDAGEDLLPPRAKGAEGVWATTESSDNSAGGGIKNRVELRPRQSKGHKLALLRGVVSIHYPLQTQQHEVTDFGALLPFGVGAGDASAQAQFTPPHLERGFFTFGSAVTWNSPKGLHALLSRLEKHVGVPEDFMWNLMGDYLLPEPARFTFTDTQGRVWRGQSGSNSAGLKTPGGQQVVPFTSPPQPLSDAFIYTEESRGGLFLMPPNVPPGIGAADYIGPPSPMLSPEEMAQVRFAKVTFSTEADWRTLEVPFEFRNLPLPPR